ncbi:3-demethylubiquinone-9 3-methyltransferase [Intrasporangium oryzae NRRL B-24470]|uniref:3-demethylubiquinone-9 3-methyltransferase n=1 Tax=Intrasporangium oryzae NRRL B-24470 TaxID=1386089 RepID=W9G7C9_9MICO|nr:VOC family protein [Intrasporangium oryzae]EWT02061.1 3-demethylubiquinone-9 3-methyltransferase [Intrasporangium oryzae NRRL B-24470]
MTRTALCLWFNGQAEEAAEFYCSVFPNSKVGRIQRYPEGSPFPAPFSAGTAMTVDFELDGQPYTALNGGPEFTFSEATSVQIFCDDQAEIDRYWNALTADGGEESMCGWLKDKYGFSWQVVPSMLAELHSEDPAKEKAVADAIFSMKKLDIAELQRAFDTA